jgi:hypothetical protein
VEGQVGASSDAVGVSQPHQAAPGGPASFFVLLVLHSCLFPKVYLHSNILEYKWSDISLKQNTTLDVQIFLSTSGVTFLTGKIGI